MSRWLTVVLSCVTFALTAGSEAVASSRQGQLEAVGVGAVKLHATGTVGFGLSGEGTLVIENQSSLRIHLRGRGDVQVTRDDRLVVSGFTGNVIIEGRRISAAFRAGAVQVDAVGHGQAVLRGRGKWAANGQRGHWSPRGTDVRW
jgi:hypothetical protein